MCAAPSPARSQSTHYFSCATPQQIRPFPTYLPGLFPGSINVDGLQRLMLRKPDFHQARQDAGVASSHAKIYDPNLLDRGPFQEVPGFQEMFTDPAALVPRGRKTIKGIFIPFLLCLAWHCSASSHVTQNSQQPPLSLTHFGAHRTCLQVALRNNHLPSTVVAAGMLGHGMKRSGRTAAPPQTFGQA